MDYLSTKEIQKQLLDMLVLFDEICGEHGIRYTLDGGTLLGAIRHKGFIPWDDDVDVMVPRPDYELLLKHSEWLPASYRFEHMGGVGNQSYLPFAKLINLSWRAQEPALVGVTDQYLWIDIFPADAIPDDPAEEKALLSKQRKLHDRGVRSIENIEEVTANPIKLLIKRATFPLFKKLFPYDIQFKRLAQNASALPYGSTNRVGNITWSYYRPQWISAEEFNRLIKLDFENRRFWAISSWDAYLTQLYGDYRQLPPESRRQSHGAKVWASEFVFKE